MMENQPIPMKTIFEYSDYRNYLQDFFENSKKCFPGFSHRFLATKLGISMPNLILLIMQGKRKLSLPLCARLSKFMKLSKKEASYFENLVGFMHAKNHDEKNVCFLRMMKLRNSVQSRKIEEHQYEYYSNWYNPVVRELVVHPQFSGDVKWLAKKVSPSITPEQAKASIKLLLELGFIKKERGGYVQKEALVSTGPEVTSLAVVNYHRAMAALASGSYDRNEKSEHNISSCTVNLSKAHFEDLIKELAELRRKTLLLAQDPSATSRVYQLNLQLFPVSKK